jgi:MFS family permease
MLGLIEAEFGETAIVGFVPTATQLGYATGLFLLLPLGDLLHRRKLIIAQFVVLALASILAAASPSAWLLVSASLVLGASSTVAQQIVPLAASLVPAQKRGATIGTVMAGVLSGILFSRTLSGYIGEH